MAVFRVNLYKVYDNVLERKAFSVPSRFNQVYLDYYDISKWSELEKIKKGNLLLLCRSNRSIWAVGYAESDCKVTDIDAFRETICFQEDGFRFVRIGVYKIYSSPVDGNKYFKGLLENNPFEEPYICVQLIPQNKDEFSESINELLTKW